MSTRTLLIAPFVLGLSAAQALGGPPQAWIAAEEEELTSQFMSQRLGTSVAISGDTLVAGAEMGNRVHVYVRDGSTWTQQAVLVSPSTPAKFGCAVAISGDTVLVGASEALVSGGFAGSAHVFVRNGSTWLPQAMLLPPDPSHASKFGSSVALFGDTAVVGMPYDSDGLTEAGSAHVFVRSAGVWSHQQELVGLDTSWFDHFGAGLAMSSDTLVVGAPEEDNQGGEAAGSAYVFTRSGATWSQQAKLTASDGQPFAVLGKSLSLSGDTLLAGATNTGALGTAGDGEGKAYVFVRQGTTWTQQAVLQASDGTDKNWFGEGVALSGDVALVGAHQDGQAGLEAGSAYVFARQGAAWSEELKLLGSDQAAGDWFGAACALAGDTAVLGAPKHGHVLTWSGAAYVFRLLDCSAAVPSAEVVRLGSPPNPAALAAGQTSGPVVGAVWDPVIDHAGFAPAAALDLLGVSTTATSIPSGIGTLLCGTSPFLVVASPAPGIPFQVPIPFACAPVGLALCAQGASVDAGGMLALTNALDIVIGAF